jgi:exopolysaccharide biosynthesis polyprenyl glycosylphosphotransferase
MATAEALPQDPRAPWGSGAVDGPADMVADAPGAGPHAPRLRIHIGLPVDVAMLALVAVAVALLDPPAGWLPLGAFGLFTLSLLAMRGGYRQPLDTGLASQLRLVADASAVAAMSVLAAAQIGGGGLPMPSLAWAWIAAVGLLGGWRAGVYRGRARARKHGRLMRRTLVVGAGRIGHLAARRLLDTPHLGLRPVGFLDKEPLAEPGIRVDLPVLGASWDLEEVIASHDVGHVVIAFSTAPDEVLVSIARRCHDLGVPVSVVPRLFEVDGARLATRRLGALPLLQLGMPRPESWQIQLKYALDRAFAAVALLSLAPILVLLTLAVRISLGAPVLFRQERIGRRGERFAMLKFRTMSGDPGQEGEADADWANAVLEGERGVALGSESPRRPTTAFGAFLRRYSLDELPQFWNILRGDMSVIGPRPERSAYVERFSPSVYRYAERHRMRPGMTGWAQVNGLRGKTCLADRVEWDNYYVENWSWGLDLTILLRTVGAIKTPPVSSERPARRRPRRRGWASLRLVGSIFGLVLTFLAVATSHARAATGVGGPSAVDQYVEQVPTAIGVHRASGPSERSGGPSASGRASGIQLSSEARARLRAIGGRSARELDAVATSPALGAPQRRLPRSHAAAPGTPSAAVGALGGGGGGQLLWLGILLGVITAAAAAIAVYERARRR